jgi:hypothetical protein
MYTITKADKRQFIIPKPIDYKFWVLALVMLASLPLGLMYYLIDTLVRGGN